MTRLINYSNACNVLDSSRCTRYRHQQRLSCHPMMPTVKSTSPFTFQLFKSTPPLTIQLFKSTPPFTFQHMTQYDYDAWTYNNDPIMHNFNITTTNDNVKVHLQLHWLAQQHLHYQVFMSTHSTNHNSNKSHQHGSTYININYAIYLNNSIYFS
jgi:hypothetical protein